MIILTFLSFILLTILCLSFIFVISIFLFDNIIITFPNNHSIKVNKK